MSVKNELIIIMKQLSDKNLYRLLYFAKGLLKNSTANTQPTNDS